MPKGLGRLYKDKEIYDGNFYKGEYWNLGIKFNLEKNSFLYGYFEKNLNKTLLESGKNYPFKLIGIS